MDACFDTIDDLADAIVPAPKDDNAPENWHLATLSRVGNPPLRFHGRAISDHLAAASDGRPLQICLWARRAGGFVISHSLPPLGADCSHAVRVETVAAGAEYLEQHCEQLFVSSEGAGAPDRAATSSFLGMLEHVYDQTVLHRRVRQFVGDVLDEWDAKYIAPATGAIEQTEAAG